MTSKISFSDIAREDLRRRVWMLALSCLGSFLSLPVIFLLANRSYLANIERRLTDTMNTMSAEDMMAAYYLDFFRDNAILTVGIVLMLGAVITAVWGFRYLYSRKMVDLYHSVPIGRNRMFFVIYLNGLLIWLIPMLISMVLTLFLMLFNMASMGAAGSFGAVMLMALRMVFVAVMSYLIIYHFLLVAVMLSGNVCNALFTSVIFGCFAAALFGLYLLLCSAFFDTFVNTGIDWEQIIWASPIISPVFLMIDFASSGAGSLFISIGKSDMDHGLFFRICSLLLMLANLSLARHLYRHRPSELAEHGVEHKGARHLIRILTAIAAGLSGGMIFQWILNEDAIAWQIFGILLCGILAFGITDIILNMNFESFFAHKLQMLLTLILSCVIFFLFAFDITGFDHRLPAENNIRSASVYIHSYTDNASGYSFDEDGIMYRSNEYYEVLEYDCPELLYPLLSQVVNNKLPSDSLAGNVEISLETTFGTFRRNYRIFQEDLDLLRPVIESESYRDTFYSLASGHFPLPEYIKLHSTLDYSGATVSDTDKMKDITETYYKEFNENYCLENLGSGIEVGTISFFYPFLYENATQTSFNDLTLPVYSWQTETIRKILEYYPDINLTLEQLDFISLTLESVNTLTDLFDLSSVIRDLPSETPDSETDNSNPEITVEYDSKYMVTAESYPHGIPELVITDPEEMAQLIPYIYAGNLDHSPFEVFREYEYAGRAETANGYTASIYFRKSDLPIEPVPSVVEYIREYPETVK